MRMFLFFLESILINVYFYTIVICLIFFSIESFSLAYILMSVNVLTAFGFLFSWFSYYFIYFLPLGIILSSLTFFYKLIKQKKIQIFYVFGISPYDIIKKSLLVVILPVIIGIGFSFLITEEDITYAKNYMLQEFAKKAIESIPPKTFTSIEDYSVFFDKKQQDTFFNIFIHSQNKYIYAKEAYYKNGVLKVRNGEILSNENGKNYVVSFNAFDIQLYKLTKNSLSNNKIKKDTIFEIINIVLSPIFVLMGFFIISKTDMSSNVFYMFLAFSVIFHEAITTLIKMFILKA